MMGKHAHFAYRQHVLEIYSSRCFIKLLYQLLETFAAAFHVSQLVRRRMLVSPVKRRQRIIAPRVYYGMLDEYALMLAMLRMI